MQLTSILFAATAMASAITAVPLEPRAASWTIQSFTRTCNDTKNTCHYAYAINLNDGSKATSCVYDVAGTSTTTARRQSYSVTCGVYAISSSWSGQFGVNNGFQTLAVKKTNQIIYPAYSDAELKDGVKVTPDKSYAPQTFTTAKNVVSN